MSDKMLKKQNNSNTTSNNIELINKLRRDLDEWQLQFIELMLSRFEITEKIWQLKLIEKLPIEDYSREEQLNNLISEKILIIKKNKSQPDFNMNDCLINQTIMKIFQSIITENKKYLLDKLNLKVVEKKSSEN